ncbi:MAG: hypothetical protein ACRDRJ_01670 [Streptosporangiaceae bacterium]
MPAADMAMVAREPDGPVPATLQRLVVAWQNPDERGIQPVGFLTYDGLLYRFAYIRHALGVADFRPLLGFPDLQGSYSSPDLFPLFAQRAMDPRRPDYQRYVARLGLEGEPGPWEQITRSQGRRQGDTIQLFPEPTSHGDELTCLFLVHGIRHAHEGDRLEGGWIRGTPEQVNAALGSLRPGDPLQLAPDLRNRFNELAVMVVGSSVPVGWVPDLLLEDLHRLRERSAITASVEHVNGPDAPVHLRLLVRLAAIPAGDFRFFTGQRWEPLVLQG